MTLKDLLTTLPHTEQKDGEEIVIECPECPEDGKLKLSVNVKTQKFQCFRCDYRGRRVEPLLKRLGLKFGKEALLQPRRAPVLVSPGPAPAPVEAPSLAGLGFSPIWDPTVGVLSSSIIPAMYLASRGISYEDAALHHIHYALTGYYKGRVIFPIFEGGVLQYFLGRAFMNGIEPKFLNAPVGMFPKSRHQLVFNIDAPIVKEYCVIFEAVIDAIVFGPEGVATFGKKVTDEQFYKLLNLNAKVYIVALDQDAFEEARELAKKLNSFGKKVWIARFPVGQDASSMGRTLARDCVSRAEPYRFGLDL